ncbi:MAG: ATP-dependent Clp protease ATP-binding subunit [Myxococcota bacterium]|jgi:ATP-dependent Clp protease ATP-binding subunit ClpC|nr:ATP-dependent Clp protease ATP-binding subunit [Myxococcota bacterium]
MDVVGVKGIVAQAKRAAQRRGQQPSTGHVLLVMLQVGGPVSDVLGTSGVRETDLLSALKVVDPEAQSTLDRVMERATRLAQTLGHAEPDARHLLLAMTRDTRTAAHRSLQQVGAGLQRVQEELVARLGAASASVVLDPPSLMDTPRPRPPMRGVTAARREPTPPRRDKRVSTASGSLLAPSSPGSLRAVALLDDKPPTVSPMVTPTTSSLATSALPLHDVAAEDSSSGVLFSPRRRPAPPRNTRPAARRDPNKPLAPLPAAPLALPFGPFDLEPERFPLLTSLGRNLTALAHDGHFDPLVGRDRELELLLDVLARRRSNNPILVGAPGVGKTAIVEGLAERLAQGVRGLEGRVVIEISAGALVGGTGVRGALAEKVRKLRDEVAGSGGRVVLFIDEIHAIVSGEGGDELAQELKASLARGELPCIGATTDVEYRKHFEKDAALARRFSPIQVEEPSPADCEAILRGLLPRYETHHGVTYEGDAARAAIELGVRFLPELRLPDKAVGILDLAAARVRRRGGVSVDRAAVASVVAEQARVPLERLLLRDGERLLRLESLLRERVIGQDEPLRRISDALRKGAAGFRGKRPLGTFLFLGPTGVGKTETAKAISDVFFGAPMTRLDMSELGEPHAVARMLGAPPGYVGHDDGGQLTEAVRKRPYQLVLLDEIEKAHPDVLLALLPLLDEGRLTDGKGRTVDFKSTIVVMTSNLGVQQASRRSIGFGGDAKDEGEPVLEAARRALPPELWNRIDEPIYFAALDRTAVTEIAERLLDALADTMIRENGVTLTVEPSVVDAIVAAGGYDAAYGARPLRRVIARLVEAPLAREVLSGNLKRGDRARLVGEDTIVRVLR